MLDVNDSIVPICALSKTPSGLSSIQSTSLTCRRILDLFFIVCLVFDKPGSEDDPRAWATFVSLCISPTPFLVGILGAWVSFARKRYRPALMWIGLPLVGVCVILLCVLYGEGF